MSTARVLARVAVGFATIGGVLAVAMLVWALLPSDPGGGANIGAGALLLLGLSLLALGAVVGVAALVARALHRRR